MISSQFRVILLILSFGGAAAFQAPSHHGMHQSHHQFCNHDITICTRRNMNLQATTDGRTSTDNTPTGPGGSDDNKAMAFLRKVGRVGGAANMDFATAMGLDESPSGGSKSSYHEGGFKNVRKSKAAYIPCTTSGIIDDMSDPFPFTSSGSQWQGITDRVMGGLSNGSLSRETIGGKLANVLRGNVSLANNGGFIQMATDLSLEPSVNLFVDASAFDGVELEVYCEGSENVEKFNVQ
ncbi:hypothetical protein ACHAWU_009546 [Discostella pseudostelligera]|uniref:NADH:ubiquinone oxidoreductase intermediate-associated protein 30 domain-containing protein n=1 Tax=Discostella pseudostelligera TaxID=259834 RepID=A0ABD3M917_9STRA